MEPPKINRYFEYPSLNKKTDSSGNRKYETPNGPLVSSVTTILSQTADKTGIEAWREKVGDEHADKELKQASDLGTLMHDHLEKWLKNEERPGGSNLIRKMATNMSNVIIENGLKDVEEIWGIEETLYYPDLYAGTADCIGIYDGQPSLIDFKNAKKIKKEEWIEDYFIQGCSYSLAHNHLFETNIENVIIFMVDRECNFQKFHIKGEKFHEFSNKWTKRLEEFLNDNNKID